MKVLYTHIIFYLVLPFIYADAENTFIYKNITDSIRKLESSGLKTSDVLELITKIFVNAYPDCKEQLEKLEPKTVKVTISKYPFIIDNIGKGLNDLGDEIECLNAFSETLYVIVEMNISNLINENEKKLKNFLNLTKFSLGACITELCQRPLTVFIDTFLNFQNVSGNTTLFKDDTNDENNEKERYFSETTMHAIFWSLAGYIIIKILCGIYRLLFYPKGYNTETLVILNEKKKEKGNDEDNEKIINDEMSYNEKSHYLLFDDEKKEYDPNYDYTTVFPLKLRILRLFDFFNDIILLSKKSNRYFNDNGLEVIIFFRSIVLYLIIFYNTFTSLFQLP